MTRREFERVCARLDFELTLAIKTEFFRWSSKDVYSPQAYDFVQIANARWAVTRENRLSREGREARRLLDANPHLRIAGEIAVRVIGAGHRR